MDASRVSRWIYIDTDKIICIRLWNSDSNRRGEGREERRFSVFLSTSRGLITIVETRLSILASHKSDHASPIPISPTAAISYRRLTMFPAERSFTASSIVVDFLRVPENTVLSRFLASFPRFLFLSFFQTSSASYPSTRSNLRGSLVLLCHVLFPRWNFQSRYDLFQTALLE